jgi:hypothetical protein
VLCKAGAVRSGRRTVSWCAKAVVQTKNISAMLERGHSNQATYNVHTHQPTCFKHQKRFGSFSCRFAFPQRRVDNTSLAELSRPPAADGEDAAPTLSSAVAASQQTLVAGPATALPERIANYFDPANTDVLQGIDPRAIVLDIRRKRVEHLFKWEGGRRNLVVFRWLWSGLRRAHPQELAGGDRGAAGRPHELNLRRVVQGIARFVGPYVLDEGYNTATCLALSAKVDCNSNCVLLGSSAQAMGAQTYLKKYMTKGPLDKTHFASCAIAASKDALQQASTAEDAGTEVRFAKFFLQKVANKATALNEFCDTQGAMAMLGHKAEVSSHNFAYLFAWPAATFQNELRARRPTDAVARPVDARTPATEQADSDAEDAEAQDDTTGLPAAAAGRTFVDVEGNVHVLAQHQHYAHRVRKPDLFTPRANPDLVGASPPRSGRATNAFAVCSPRSHLQHSPL